MPVALSPAMHTDRIALLCRQSVKKHHDAYADVDWDHPDHRIRQDDPRFELPATDPLGATDWYRSLPAERRARLGLAIVVSQMQIGIEFESVLSRGLLELASTLPAGAPALRYAYHEVIEESQHSLMFQEFVARSGMRAHGQSPFLLYMGRRVPALGRTFPELFFVHVLGGEGPIDSMQRGELSSGRALHPLLERIVRIHVMEEARHVSFARTYLEGHMPRLSWLRATRLRWLAPIIIRDTARIMTVPPAPLQREHGVPTSVAREAYRSPAQRARIVAGVASFRGLAQQLGIVTSATRPWWRALGLGEEKKRIGSSEPALLSIAK